MPLIRPAWQHLTRCQKPGEPYGVLRFSAPSPGYDGGTVPGDGASSMLT
jgi:hypothetical protein